MGTSVGMRERGAMREKLVGMPWIRAMNYCPIYSYVRVWDIGGWEIVFAGVRERVHLGLV